LVSHGFDVLNPFSKHIGFLLSGKFFIMHSIWICHYAVTMILLLLKVTVKLFSFEWLYINYWKDSGLPYIWCDEFNEQIIFAYGWVEVLHNIIYLFFHNATIILLLLETYLEIIFLRVFFNKLPKEIDFPSLWCAEYDSKCIWAFGSVEVIYNDGICIFCSSAFMILLLLQS